jgi:hypothetical protein
MMIKFTKQTNVKQEKKSSKMSKTGNKRNRTQSNSMRIAAFLDSKIKCNASFMKHH